MDDETQGIADARETRDLVLARALTLAQRVVDHVENHEVSYAVIEERLDGGGFEWSLKAAYGEGHTFVSVQGSPEPAPDTPAMVTMQQMAAIMGNSQAGFTANVPRSWVELAARAAEQVSA